MILREFLDLTENSVLCPGLCYVYVEEFNEQFKDYDANLVKFGDREHPNNMEDLNPYLDYEVRKFRQEYMYGEIDCQDLTLRKVEESGEQVIYITSRDEAVCPHCHEVLAEDEFWGAKEHILFCPKCGTKLNWNWIKVRSWNDVPQKSK